MKKPNFGTACDTCAHLRGGPAGRDERDTAWVWECNKGHLEFYEEGDFCPEHEYREEIQGEYDPFDYEQTEKAKKKYDFDKRR